MTDSLYPLTERSIQLSLRSTRLSGSDLACPNYTPSGWWECDLWHVTKAGYATEYEIKLTLVDYKNDATKTMDRFEVVPGKRERIRESKHDLLASGCERGPSRFYYCVPDTLADTIAPTLPAWAGLLAFTPRINWCLPYFKVLKEAPRLHKAKVPQSEIDLCKDRIVCRYWQAIHDLHQGVAEERVTA